MKEYSIAVIFWDDHYSASRETLPFDPDGLMTPVMSVGIIVEESDKSVLLVHDIERYQDRDDCTYTRILKGTIVGRKNFGTIEIEEPRRGNG